MYQTTLPMAEQPWSPQSALAPAPARPERTRWAILMLFFLAPVTAEVLTGSTPILIFLTSPFAFIANPLLYGCGSLLIREVVRRRGLGWASVLWLGAAYGIFEEGVALNTWADPWTHAICATVQGKPSGLCDYSRVGGINLLWALGLTTFHAIISITIPILLTELSFPRLAARSWLGRKAIVACVIGEILFLAFGILLNFVDFRKHGQAGPLLAPYLIEVGLMVGCITLALSLAPRASGMGEGVGIRPASPRRPAPQLWVLRIFGFLCCCFNLLASSIYQGAHLPFLIGLALNGALMALAIWRVATWARRPGWNARHPLALATGALAFFFFFWDPLLELLGSAGGNTTRGTLVVALIYLIGLILLSRRTKARLA